MIFKKGDKVRVVADTFGHGLPKGHTGEILDISPTGNYIMECIDGNGKVYVPANDLIYFDSAFADEHKDEDEDEDEDEDVDVDVDEKINSDTIGTYIYIGDTIIAVPRGTPISMSNRNSLDTYYLELGETLALKRMLDDGFEKKKFKITIDNN